MTPIREKRHRLSPESYIGKVTVAYTTCIRNRYPFFRNDAMVGRFRSELIRFADKYGCWLPVYCFMPDHLHVMISGQYDSSRPKAVMDSFKTATGIWLRNNVSEVRWQRSYHDHIARCGDDWVNQAFYILNNPTRAGLVKDPYEYPFSGSHGYKLEQLFWDLTDR